VPVTSRSRPDRSDRFPRTLRPSPHYTATASATGYQSASASVSITKDATTTQDFAHPEPHGNPRRDRNRGRDHEPDRRRDGDRGGHRTLRHHGRSRRSLDSTSSKFARRKHGRPGSGPERPATCLRLPATATRAGVVSSDAPPALERRGSQLGHHRLRPSALPAPADDLAQRGFRVREEVTESFAEVIEPGISRCIEAEPVFRAPAVADRSPSALAALRRQRRLGGAKTPLLRAVDQRAEVILGQVSEAMLGVDKVVARVNGAVMLDHQHAPARTRHPAEVRASTRPDELLIDEQRAVPVSPGRCSVLDLYVERQPLVRTGSEGRRDREETARLISKIPVAASALEGGPPARSRGPPRPARPPPRPESGSAIQGDDGRHRLVRQSIASDYSSVAIPTCPRNHILLARLASIRAISTSSSIPAVGTHRRRPARRYRDGDRARRGDIPRSVPPRRRARRPPL
jgi:hypothetical protein